MTAGYASMNNRFGKTETNNETSFQNLYLLIFHLYGKVLSIQFLVNAFLVITQGSNALFCFIYHGFPSA